MKREQFLCLEREPDSLFFLDPKTQGEKVVRMKLTKAASSEVEVERPALSLPLLQSLFLLVLVSIVPLRRPKYGRKDIKQLPYCSEHTSFFLFLTKSVIRNDGEPIFETRRIANHCEYI